MNGKNAARTEMITAISVAVILIIAVLVAVSQNSQSVLMPVAILALLYLSMMRKWKKLSETNRKLAIVSFVTHVIAMVFVVLLMFYSIAQFALMH